jgi:hypothetical protein
MVPLPLEKFRDHTYVVDTEYRRRPGHVLDVHCFSLIELWSGRTVSLWADELSRLRRPPHPIGPGALFVAYNAMAELGSYLSLGWDLPAMVVDLLVEFRMLTNGTDWREKEKSRHKLIHALQCFKIGGVDAVEKGDMQALAMRGGPFTPEERRQLLHYCGQDVKVTAELLRRMAPGIPLQALQRGRFLRAAAKMVHAGVPLDADTLAAIHEGRSKVIRGLADEVNPTFGVYQGSTLKDRLLEEMVECHRLAWPRKQSGCLDKQGRTWDRMVAAYPFLAPLRECVREVGLLRQNKLAVGPDGRSRADYLPFVGRTGRNAWKAAEFIFAQPAFLRGLVQPRPGRGLAYLDYGSQEVAVVARLSGDDDLLAVYEAEDIYRAFGRRAGLALDRKKLKAAFLALQYCVSEWGLADTLGISTDHALDLVRAHQRSFPKLWSWIRRVQDRALLDGFQETLMGWRVTVRAGDTPKGVDRWGRHFNPKSAANFPVQGGASDITRLACNLTSEAGIALLASVHDSLLVEADERDIDQAAAAAEAFMVRAGQELLGGVRLKVDRQVIRYPERLHADEAGWKRWGWLMLKLGLTTEGRPIGSERVKTGAVRTHPMLTDESDLSHR